MALTYVQLALGTCEIFPEAYDVVEDHYMVRDQGLHKGVD